MNDITQKITAFFANYPEITIEKNNVFIQFHDTEPEIYYLTSGIVEQYDVTKNGKKTVLNIYKPGAFFPLLTAFSNVPNKYFFAAGSSSVTLKKAPAEDVVMFLRENPDVLFDLTSRLYRGIDGLLQRLNTTLAGSAEERVVLELRLLSMRLNTHTLNITTNQLAEQSGLARETVSRVLSKLEAQKIITHTHGYITII